MMSNSQYKIAVSITSTQSTLSQAAQLIELAREHPEHDKLLSACAAVVLASALQQGIKAALNSSANTMAAEDDMPPDRTPYAELGRSSFRDQMLKLPGLISSGQFEISKQSPLTCALHELITLRNRLAHIDDEARLLTENSAEVKVEGHLMQISVPIPPNPWDSINLNDVERFEQAERTRSRAGSCVRP